MFIDGITPQVPVITTVATTDGKLVSVETYATTASANGTTTVVDADAGKRHLVLSAVLTTGALSTDITLFGLPLLKLPNSQTTVLPFNPAGWAITEQNEAYTITLGVGSGCEVALQVASF